MIITEEQKQKYDKVRAMRRNFNEELMVTLWQTHHKDNVIRAVKKRPMINDGYVIYNGNDPHYKHLVGKKVDKANPDYMNGKDINRTGLIEGETLEEWRKRIEFG